MAAVTAATAAVLLRVSPAALVAFPTLARLHDDTAVWARYASARSAVAAAATFPRGGGGTSASGNGNGTGNGNGNGSGNSDGNGEGDGDGSAEDDEYDEEGTCLLVVSCHKRVRADLDAAGVTTVARDTLLRSMAQRWSDVVWEDVDDLHPASVHTALWSPLALPMAVELSGRWHHRRRWSSVEYCRLLSVRSRPPLAGGGAGPLGRHGRGGRVAARGGAGAANAIPAGMSRRAAAGAAAGAPAEGYAG